MDALTIDLDDASNPRVLTLGGEIDLATADELRAVLDRALADDPDVVVDLRAVTFIDAAGIRAFLGAASVLNGSGPLRIVNAPRLAWMFELVGLGDLDTIEIDDGHGR
jgi:anti-anti-sigma factor